MRILVSTPTFFPIVGGAELLIRDVLEVWAEDHEVRLLTPHLDGRSSAFWVDDASLESACRFEIARFRDRFNLMDLPGHRKTRGIVPPVSLSVFPELSRQIRSFRPDALVTFFGAPYGLPSVQAARRHGIPMTLVLCGTEIPSPRTAVAPIWHSYLRRTARAADRVVYVSRFCFDALFPRGHFTPPHDNVIYGGIGLTDEPKAESAIELRRRLGLTEDDVMVFSLSRLGPEKRMDVLLRAFASLPALPRRVRLVIGGQGAEAEALQALARTLGIDDDVVFTGYLGPEKDIYYQAADIFAFHSLFETFGQVLVEAMAAGKPVVAVRAGAIPEVVAHGETGLLSQPLDVEAIAGDIAALVIDEPRRLQMGAAARRRVEELFDWEAARGSWASLLSADALVPSRVENRGGVA